MNSGIDGTPPERPIDLNLLQTGISSSPKFVTLEDSPWLSENSWELQTVMRVISPTRSETEASATSSVSERQRRLSGTVVDWVFDGESSEDYQFSDSSEDTSTAALGKWLNRHNLYIPSILQFII